MRDPLTRKLSGLGTSVFAEMSALALRHGAINLAQGFPDFDGPDFVKRAAHDAIDAGHGQYARTHGVPALNAAIARSLAERNGLTMDPETEITVTSGATEAIFAAIAGSCDPGDEVILFEPFYDSYLASVRLAGATPRVVTLRPTDGIAGRWTFDPDELRRAITPATRGILLNTPHNPTGKVFTRAELEIIAALCVEHDVICWSDEVYERLVYEGEHISIATIPGMRERTVTISSLGKTFSLTGWKIGWTAAPPALTKAVRGVHQFTTFCSATPLQHAAIAALNAPGSYDDTLVAEYRSRRDLLAGELTRLGFDVRAPAGSYFICAGFQSFMDTGGEPGNGWIRATKTGADVRFCHLLVQEAGVAAIPPSAFYADSSFSPGFVRFAFCKREETLRAAVARLEAALPRLRALA